MTWTAKNPKPIVGERISIDMLDYEPKFPPEPGGDSQRSQYLAVARAVRDLAAAIGRPEDEIAVEVIGHANPGHRPVKGWSNEFIQLTVRQVVKEPEAPAEQDAEA